MRLIALFQMLIHFFGIFSGISYKSQRGLTRISCRMPGSKIRYTPPPLPLHPQATDLHKKIQGFLLHCIYFFWKKNQDVLYTWIKVGRSYFHLDPFDRLHGVAERLPLDSPVLYSGISSFSLEVPPENVCHGTGATTGY